MKNGDEGNTTIANLSGNGTDNVDTFSKLYHKQIAFQLVLLHPQQAKTLPTDSIDWFVYHTAAMVEELGELMKADKRWKTHRNTAYNRDEKLSELADVFITAMNLGIFSGFSSEELFFAVYKKIADNAIRLQSKQGEQKQ